MDGQLAVRVSPNASRNEIKVSDEGVRVYVTTIPEDGKANKAVIKLLSKALGVSKSSCVLIRGVTSRNKTFEIRS